MKRTSGKRAVLALEPGNERASPQQALKKQLDQIEQYRRFADDHWAYTKEQQGINYTEDKNKFWARLSADTRIDHNHTGRAFLTDLFGAFSYFPDFKELKLPPNTQLPKRDIENAEIEWQMYQKLAFWLCSYFLGVPQCNVWEDTALMAGRLGAFPGGAFYDKMAGDVYRFERRQYAKGLRTPTDSVLVMAYTPLLLIPDEQDLNYISIPEEKHSIFGDEHLSFMGEVEKLACRYLRYQAWRFFNEKEKAPIAYAVSQVSLVTALRDLADRKYLLKIYPGEDKREERRRIKQRWMEQEQTNNGTIPPERKTPEWQEHFDTILHESEQRIKLFIHPQDANCRLAIFADTATKRRGLTSCILGQEDGVITNRPNRTDQATAFCSWTEGIVLKEERQKLENLWKHTQHGEEGFHLYVPGKPFVQSLCDEAVRTRCFIPSLMSNQQNFPPVINTP